MKYLFLPLILLSSVLSLAAQTANLVTSQNSDLYQFGDKTVRIPPPVGFTDVTGRIEDDRNFFQRFDAEGENLTYVRDELVSLLQANPKTPLGFYAKGWIPGNHRTNEITAQYFAQVVAVMESGFATIVDPNSQIMIKAKKQAMAFSTKNLDPKASIDFKETTNLGFIQKSDRVFSAMALLSAQINGQPFLSLTSFSVLRLNNRLVWVYCFAPTPTEKDFEMLPKFTRTWTAAIIAANSKLTVLKK